MKQGVFFFLCLSVCLMSACGALGVPPQSSYPITNEQNIGTQLPPPTQQAQVTFPQMTQTAQAVPTVPVVTEPTQTLSLPNPNDPVVVSPNGIYAVACKNPFLVLFDTRSNKTLSSFNRTIYDCEQEIHWSSDSSYATFIINYDTIMRWRVDGSLPEQLHVNIVQDINDFRCNGKWSWSPDGQYLAIDECGVYVIRPFDELSFADPLLVEKSYYEDFRWTTMPGILIVQYHSTDAFIRLPSGNWLGSMTTSGGICVEQVPLISPDEDWMVFDRPWCGGGEPGKNQSAIVSIEDGSERIFSESFADRIDFVGWSKDSSKLYLISRPTKIDALPDPRTPFGLLVMNPETLEVQNLFEQVWFVAFNEDYSWAYVIFSSKNDDGSLRLDGGLWQVGKSQLIGRQVMATSLEDKFLEQHPVTGFGYLYSPTGEELSSNTLAALLPLPAVWSHQGTQIATINSTHQLMVIDINRDVKLVGQLDDDQEWLYSEIIWADDDTSINVNGVTWTVP